MVYFDFDHDFILKDSEFYQFAMDNSAFCEELENTLETYDWVIQQVLNEGVTSGKVHDALVVYQDYVKKLKKQASGIGKSMEQAINSFIKKVDKADDFLYGSSGESVYSALTRDFSQAEYDKLEKYLTSDWYNSAVHDSSSLHVLEWLTKKAISLIEKVIPMTKDYFDQCTRMIVDLNDESIQTIRQIFLATHEIDTAYGGGHELYGGHFGSLCEMMHKVHVMIQEMNVLISGGEFTAQAVELKLGPLYRELSKLHDQVVSVDYEKVPTVTEIAAFAGQDWAPSYFSGVTSLAVEYAEGIDWGDGVLMVYTQMYDMFKTKVVGTVSSFFDSPNAPQRYEDMVTESYLMSLIIDAANTRGLFDDLETKDLYDDASELLALYKKYGGKINKYLKKNMDGTVTIDGKKYSQKDFSNFMDWIGRAGTILEIGGEATELVLQYYADYTESIEILDSIQRTYGSQNDEFSRAMAHIRELYEKDVDAHLGEAAEVIAKHGYDEAKRLLKKVKIGESSFSNVFTIFKTMKSANEMSGLGDEMKAKYDFMIYRGIYNSTRNSYENALSNLQELDPSSKAYASAAKDVENSFNLCKDSAAKMFECMMNSSSGIKRSYYRYCKQQVSGASILDKAPMSFMSYEDFANMDFGG